MKTFSIRIDEELFDKVEAARGEKARTDFLREVIAGYFVIKSSPELNLSSPELNQASPDHNLPSPEQVKHMDEIDHLRAQNIELMKLLEKEQNLVSQAQALQMQTQKQIMPAQEEIKKKAWWQFWK